MQAKKQHEQVQEAKDFLAIWKNRDRRTKWATEQPAEYVKTQAMTIARLMRTPVDEREGSLLMHALAKEAVEDYARVMRQACDPSLVTLYEEDKKIFGVLQAAGYGLDVKALEANGLTPKDVVLNNKFYKENVTAAGYEGDADIDLLAAIGVEAKTMTEKNPALVQAVAEVARGEGGQGQGGLGKANPGQVGPGLEMKFQAPHWKNR